MSRPLVVVTRREKPDDALGRPLQDGGADVLWLPTTASLPPLDGAPLDGALARLPETDWLVFSSGRAVEAVCSRPGWAGAWRGSGRRPRVAAVGERTAERLSRHGVAADVVPRAAGATALVAALVAAAGGTLAGRSVLWPRSDIARRELADGLARAGATVHEPVAYRTVCSPPAAVEAFRAALGAGRVAAVCFLSPSAADGLALALGSNDLVCLRGRCLVASLGPTTSAALAGRGAPADVEAEPPSAAGLAHALLARLSSVEGVLR